MREENEALAAYLAHEAALEEELPSSDVPRVWNALSQKLVLTQPTIQRHTYRSWTAVGAALAACLVIGISVKYVADYKTAKQSSQIQTYHTASGQRATVTLPDGSRAILAPATILKFANRTIELSGEAVFTVNQHTDLPFIVRAGNSATRVIGTTFGVRKYQSDVLVRVAVAEGKVSVAKSVITSGDVMTITDTSTHVSHNSDVSSILGWTSGKLTFKQTAVPTAFADLSRWYGVEITTDNPVLKERAITTIVNGETLEQTLKSIAFVTGSRYERKGNRISFTIR